MKNVIAYSLWGDHPMYWKGALRNIEIVKEKLPNWICRFYIDKNSKKELIETIVGDNVEVFLVDTVGGFHGMFWRFWAADDPEVNIMLSRDCDSRISDREVAAINQWLDSDKDFHIMRDHPYHGVPILGGMWGCRNGILRNIGITEKINSWNKYERKGIDQDFLGQVIYPLVKNYAFVHDEFFNYDTNKNNFPMKRTNYEFVGEIYNEKDERHPEHWKLIK
jgi:hypothetical protein